MTCAEGPRRPTPRPGDAQTGPQAATLRVTDPGGLFGEESFTVTVANVNDPPVITSSPPVGDLVAAAPYVYAVAVADPDPGDTLAFALDVAQKGARGGSVFGRRVERTPDGPGALRSRLNPSPTVAPG